MSPLVTPTRAPHHHRNLPLFIFPLYFPPFGHTLAESHIFESHSLHSLGASLMAFTYFVFDFSHLCCLCIVSALRMTLCVCAGSTSLPGRRRPHLCIGCFSLVEPHMVLMVYVRSQAAFVKALSASPLSFSLLHVSATIRLFALVWNALSVVVSGAFSRLPFVPSYVFALCTGISLVRISCCGTLPIDVWNQKVRNLACIFFFGSAHVCYQCTLLDVKSSVGCFARGLVICVPAECL